jgi:5-methylthioribose kinase
MNEQEVIALVTGSFGGRWSQAEPLEGGLINQVWRLTGKTGSLIAKYAPPYIASQPEVALSPLRLRFEALCLNHFGGRTGPVSPPRLLAYFKAAGVVLMEDCGELPSLGEALAEAAVDGAVLGSWLRDLHDRTAARSEFKVLLRNKDVQEARFEQQYRKVADWLAAAGEHEAERLGAVAEALGLRLLREARCVIMGDLWPRSLLVQPGRLRVIDWEFAHFGSPIQDVAHLAAHCWMGAHCAADSAERERWRQFWQEFYAAYGELGAADRRDGAIHIGAEILTRTVGAFQDGYLYAGQGRNAPRVLQAVEVACTCLRDWSLDAFSAGGPAWESFG